MKPLPTFAPPDTFQAPPCHRVSLHALVDYEEIPKGQVHTVMLVPPTHADEREGLVSTFAPLGRALLGVRVGSIVDVPLADGSSTCLQVLAVRPGGADGYSMHCASGSEPAT